MMEEGPAGDSGDARPREIRTAPIVVAVVVVTEWIQSHLSLYRWAVAVASRNGGRLRAENRLRRRSRGPAQDEEILVAGAPDAAMVYVGSWLGILAVLTLLVPRLTTSSATTVAGSGLVIVIASSRFIDLVSYQVGLLLDPRQRHLRGAERSLVLLSLNLVELTLIGTIWF
jgi:hypothetical protein